MSILFSLLLASSANAELAKDVPVFYCHVSQENRYVADGIDVTGLIYGNLIDSATLLEQGAIRALPVHDAADLVR